MRDAGEQIERTQAQGEGNRRGLGPGGTRGTIELLCGGGGGIAALEVPTVVGYKILHLSQAEPLFFLVRLEALSGPVGGWNKAESSAEAEGKRRE